MPFPATKKLLKEAGYHYMTKKTCPCGAPLELWRTPENKAIPMNPMADDDSKAESHFANCPLARQFRRRKT